MRFLKDKDGKIKPPATSLGERLPATLSPSTEATFLKSFIVVFLRNTSKGMISTKEKMMFNHDLERDGFDESCWTKFAREDDVKMSEQRLV